jgi:hypothetical protein
LKTVVHGIVNGCAVDFEVEFSPCGSHFEVNSARPIVKEWLCALLEDDESAQKKMEAEYKSFWEESKIENTIKS